MNVNNLTELKFSLKRVKGDYKRVHITNFDNNTECLIDTGSSCAVWCLGEIALIKKYPNAIKLTDTYFLVGGFGGEQMELLPAYKLPIFCLSDETTNVIFKDLHVAVIKRDFACSLILGYSLLNKANIMIRSFSNKLEKQKISPYIKLSFQQSTINTSIKYINMTDKLQKYLIKKYPDKTIKHLFDYDISFSQI